MIKWIVIRKKQGHGISLYIVLMMNTLKVTWKKLYLFIYC
jgi:hypothetical protein